MRWVVPLCFRKAAATLPHYIKPKRKENPGTQAKPMLPGLFFFGGEAVVADAADFGTGDSDADVAVAGDLLFELLVEARLELTDFAAAETGDVNVIARAVRFVIVAVAAEMEQVELVNKTLALEEIDGAVNRNEVDFRIDSLGAFKDLVDVEVLLGGVHDLENDAALAGQADAALAEGGLEMAGWISGIDAFAAGDTPGWSCRHSNRWPQENFNRERQEVGSR
jgi:hypothetical protein